MNLKFNIHKLDEITRCVIKKLFDKFMLSNFFDKKKKKKINE